MGGIGKTVLLTAACPAPWTSGDRFPMASSGSRPVKVLTSSTSRGSCFAVSAILQMSARALRGTRDQPTSGGCTGPHCARRCLGRQRRSEFIGFGPQCRYCPHHSQCAGRESLGGADGHDGRAVARPRRNAPCAIGWDIRRRSPTSRSRRHEHARQAPARNRHCRRHGPPRSVLARLAGCTPRR